MSFIEVIRHPPFIMVLTALVFVVILVGFFIWYFKVGQKREEQFNEKQRKHVTFRRAFVVPIVIGPNILYRIIDLPKIQLQNGWELSLKFLVCMGLFSLLCVAMLVGGRLIYGEEGCLKPKKEKS